MRGDIFAVLKSIGTRSCFTLARLQEEDALKMELIVSAIALCENASALRNQKPHRASGKSIQKPCPADCGHDLLSKHGF
jgi:hypothetical protein